MDFEVSEPQRDAGISVVQARGELDIASVPHLQAVLLPEAATGAQVILDGTGLSFADSTGVTLFVRAHRDALQAGGRLDLVLVEPAVLRVLELSGLMEILNVHESVERARQVG